MGKAILFYVEDKDDSLSLDVDPSDMPEGAICVGTLEQEHLQALVARGVHSVLTEIDDGWQSGIEAPGQDKDVPIEQLVSYYQQVLADLIYLANVHAAGEALLSNLADPTGENEIPF